MTSIEEADSWIGRTALDSTGEQIGMITQIWVDDASAQPEWATISVATLGGRGVLVPLAGSSALGSGRQFAYSREQISRAPAIAQDGHLEVADKDQVAAYYGSPGSEPNGRSANWTDRVGDSSRMLAGRPSDSAPAPGPVKEKVGRRFGRKSETSATPESKPRGSKRFGRKPAPADPTAIDPAFQHEEVPA